jgi:hypothetical protein
MVLIAQIGDRHPLNQVLLENEDLFLGAVIIPMFAHGEFLRFCTLSQTTEFSNQLPRSRTAGYELIL